MSLESCGACGKADEGLKVCKACKLVKYCSVDCQLAHRPKHKKACRQKARELFEVKLFEQPLKREDCPICMLILPPELDSTYLPCCGKYICNGCVYSLTRNVCPYCNRQKPSVPDFVKMFTERIENYNDPNAMSTLGSYYNFGLHGFPVDYAKAVELWRRASELGSAVGHGNLGGAYLDGRGVGLDKKKAIYHLEMGAMMGDEVARYNLGYAEFRSRNTVRALRHVMIGARYGNDLSLQKVKEGFARGLVTHDDFESTLREHQASEDEIKSEQRDRVKAARANR